MVVVRSTINDKIEKALRIPRRDTGVYKQIFNKHGVGGMKITDMLLSSWCRRPSFSSVRSLRVVLGALAIFVMLVQLRYMISVSSRSDNTDNEILLAMPHDARRDIQKPHTTSSSYDRRPKEAAPEEEVELTPPINNDDTQVTINISPMLPSSPRIIPRIVVVNIQHNNNHHAWTARFFRNSSSKRIGYGRSGGDGGSGTEGLRERMSNTHSRLISVHRADVFHKRSSVHKLIDTPTLDCPSEYCAHITPDWYDPIGLDYVDGYDNEHCEPMYEWQMSAYPTCNTFHEIHMERLGVLNSGGSRTAYEMNIILDDGTTGKFVYKTVKYSKDFDQKKMDEQRKDSLIMERTTSSKFIPNVYGYCSLAVQMDLMPEGNMHQYIKASRLAGGSSLPPVDKLRVAIHIATSVADLHTIDNTSMPSVFHNDLCCHQYLFQNGIFKLNDFNYLRPIYINKRTKEQCTRKQFNMAMWKARSLEEYRYYAGDTTYTGCKPDKADVWMMGNLIYYILTDLYTFEKPNLLSWKDSGRELLAGRRSYLPPSIANSNDPSYIAIIKALDMCWTQEWEKRPSARHISNYLLLKLRIITGEKEPDLRVVLPERDQNMSNTESDYEYHND